MLTNTFEGWWNKYTQHMLTVYGVVFNHQEKSLAQYIWNEAQPRWLPISSAPSDTKVMVGWYDEEGYWVECRDILEDGEYWINHLNSREHYDNVKCAGMTTDISEDAPYTHWMLITEPPKLKG